MKTKLIHVRAAPKYTAKDDLQSQATWWLLWTLTAELLQTAN